MTELYFTHNSNVENKLKTLLDRRICGSYAIKRTKNGKPYIEGDPLYFSISHSGDRAVIAICDEPAGVDLEIIADRRISCVLGSFTERECLEINGDLTEFLRHWTAKEAYVKMLGGTLAGYLKKTEFYGGEIYYDGIAQPCKISAIQPDSSVICAICAGQSQKIELYEI